MSNEDDINWLAVVGRSLAYLAMHNAGIRDEDLVDQADFLMKLGLSKKEAALFLGSSANSLSVMQARAKRKNDKKK